MTYYEYNLRQRCVTREQLEAERRLLQVLVADPTSPETARRANIERLAAVNRLIEEITQTTLAL
jgi:hypothetical protein